MERKRKPSSQLTLDGQIQKRYKGIEDPSVQCNRAGTISHVLLRNFMCHSLLEVKFVKNINFIMGRNGSGKSAILTALIIGLGGKATLTNRGNSIKGFIKAGKNSSSIEIALTNEGPMAYRPNVYGNRIVIIRNFTASGGGNYKIKSASGDIVSTQAKEVQRICLGLNIQVDNPVCILNQDTSRNFLNTKDPQQKYVLFMRATRLETLYEKYRLVHENKSNSLRLMQSHEDTLRKLKQEIEELEQKLENHRSIVKLQHNVSLLQQELIWAEVRDLEQDLQTKEAAVQKLEEEVASAQEEIDNNNERSKSIDEEIECLQNKIGELRQAIGEQNGPVQSLGQKLKTLQTSYKEKSREKSLLEHDVKNKSLDCQTLEEEIAKITSNLEEIEQDNKKRLQEIDHLEEKLRDIQNILETSQNERFQLQNSITHKQEEEYNLQSEIEQIKAQISNINTRINSIKNESSNLVLYGRDMPKIIQVIEASRSKFHQVPRGPLGSYIKLKDKKWAVAVEGFIGASLLKAFAVDNQHDNALLMDIFNKHWTSGSKPIVITSKFFFQVHDVSRNIVKQHADCISFYEVLEISDPVVANCLIDQLGIESILLLPSTDTAIELMSNSKNVPKNCRQGITITGDKYYPDPNYKMYSSRYKHAQFLQVSTDDMIRQLKVQLQSLQEKKQAIQKQEGTVSTEVSEQKDRIKALDLKITKLNKAHAVIKRKYDELRATEEPDVTNIHALENELKELKAGIEQRKVVLKKVETSMSDIQGEIQETQENLAKAKDSVRNFEDRLMPLEHQLANVQSKHGSINVNVRCVQQRLEQNQNKLRLAQSEYLAKKNKVNEQSRQAVAIGNRPNVLRQVQEIMVSLNETERNLRRIESNVEKPEEIARNIEEKSEKYNKNSGLLEDLRKDVKEVQIASERRKKFYKCLEDYFVTLFRTSFQQILNLRQFQGNVEIDSKNKKLDLIVIPQQGSQGHTTTSNLSGGERSFSTVAFLYSLWQCMEFPFYVLDEFDVFMDKVNRTKVVEILLYHAKSAKDKQFVFLTPQDLSFVNDDDVAIHRLEDPERAPVN